MIDMLNGSEPYPEWIAQILLAQAGISADVITEFGIDVNKIKICADGKEYYLKCELTAR